MRNQASDLDKEFNDYNLPSRKERHKKKRHSNKNISFNINQLKLSHYILKTLVFLFVILIITIPFAYIYWLQ